MLLAEKGDSGRLLLSDGSELAVDGDEYAKWQPGSSSPLSPSPAYRLIQLADEDENAWGGRANLVAGAIRLAQSDLTQSRLFARAVAEAGRVDLLPELAELPLSESEREWVHMHCYVRADMKEQALNALVNLPVEGYPDKVGIALRLWTTALEDQGGEKLLAQVEHLSPRMEFARLLVALLRPDDARELNEWAEVATLASGLLSAGGKVDEAEALDTLVQGCLHPSRIRPTAMVDIGASTAGFRTACAFHQGASAPDIPDSIGQLDPVIVDELLDRGVVEPLLNSSQPSPYVLARIAPERVSDADLEGLKFFEEAARRAFLNGEQRRLEHFARSCDTQATQRLLHLSRLRNGDLEAIGELTSLLGDVEKQTATEFVAAIRKNEFSGTLLADRSVYPTLAGLMAAKTLQAPPETHSFQAWATLHSAKEEIYRWDWESAARTAREALRVAEEELLRDEALNLLAYAQFEMGNGEAAVQALEKALEDQYTPELQANIGVVAGLLAPEVAGEHLGRLAHEAPSLRLRIAAAMRALDLWTLTRKPWDEDDDDDEGEDIELREVLQTALRTLAVEQGTELDEHNRILRVLAQFDSNWLADSANTKGSPHSDAPMHKVYVARAQSMDAYITTLTAWLRTEPDSEWLNGERDSFVATLRELMFDDEPHFGAAAFAHSVIEEGMPLDPWDQVVLTAGSIRIIVGTVDTDEATPSEGLLEMLVNADKIKEGFSKEDRERIEPLLSHSFEAYAAVLHDGLVPSLNQIRETGNAILAQINSLGFFESVDYGKVRGATRPMLEFLASAKSRIEEVDPYVNGPELAEILVDMLAHIEELRSWLQGLGKG